MTPSILIPATLIHAILLRRHLSITACENIRAYIRKMPSEPEWLEYIPSSTVCTWFYFLAIVNSVFSVAGVIGLIIIVSKGNKSLLSIVPLLVAILVGLINAWMMFVVCKRGINNEGFKNSKMK